MRQTRHEDLKQACATVRPGKGIPHVLAVRLAYLALLGAVSPILLWRMVDSRQISHGMGRKILGTRSDADESRPCLWFQAVSVGEVLQLEPVLAELRRRLPGVEFVISTTTPTGLSVARSKFPADRVCYFPLDFSWAVREAIRRLRPTAIVLVELELWPNFVFKARRAGIPLALINGRISQRSSRGYGHIRPLMSRLLECFEILAAQNAVYAERLSQLGAPQNRLQTTGSIKFDRVTTDRDNPRTLELRRFFGIGPSERVFIAGSTQAPEEVGGDRRVYEVEADSSGTAAGRRSAAQRALRRGRSADRSARVAAGSSQPGSRHESPRGIRAARVPLGYAG